MDIYKAIDVISRFGNVHHSSLDLLSQKPTEKQLQAVAEKCHAAVDAAIETVRLNYNMPAPAEGTNQ
jgi:hypothetical protein